MIPADPITEAAILTRDPTAWGRMWRDYDLLTIAGIPDDEALRIATEAEADRVAELTRQEAHHAA